MAFTAADLSALDQAIASGAVTVRFADGRSVTYQSASDLMRARAFVAAEIAAASGAQAPRQGFAEFVRG